MPTDALDRFVSKMKRISEQSSPFRRWTTGSGAGSSYRHQEHRNMYNKQMSEGSAPMSSGSGGSRVASWSLSLEQLLADPSGAAAFEHFLSKEFAAENIRFWWSCEQYRATTDEAERARLADEIWRRHLADSAPEPVNVDAPAARHAALLLHHRPPPHDLFLQAQKQIFNVMKFDSYPRFLRSAQHAECARAELRGLPPPYPPQHGKLKKSASNASERRRSGGASLLPWRRPASKDRGEPNNSQSNGDAVRSNQPAVSQSSLCRVILPDGATSVVPVDPDVSVGRIVDRLLQKRNLLCPNYDVFVEDQDAVRPVDRSAPPPCCWTAAPCTPTRSCRIWTELACRSWRWRRQAWRRSRAARRPACRTTTPRAPTPAAAGRAEAGCARRCAPGPHCTTTRQISWKTSERRSGRGYKASRMIPPWPPAAPHPCPPSLLTEPPPSSERTPLDSWILLRTGDPPPAGARVDRPL